MCLKDLFDDDLIFIYAVVADVVGVSGAQLSTYAQKKSCVQHGSKEYVVNLHKLPTLKWHVPL